MEETEKKKMGRPKLDKGRAKTTGIRFALSPEDKESLKFMATVEKRTMSDLVRILVRNAMMDWYNVGRNKDEQNSIANN